MLKHLRNNKVRNYIFMGLAAILILGMALPVFVLDGEAGKSGDRAGTINGKKVTLQDLLASYNAVRHQAQFMYGDQFERIQPYLNFEKEAWDRLLLLDYAKRQGIRVGDGDVVKWVGQQQVFLRDGRFDAQFYRVYVERYLRSTPRRFEEEIRELLMIAQVTDKIRDGVAVADEDVRAAYENRNGSKDLKYGFLSADKLLAGVKVEEDEIARVYSAVQDQLTSAPRVKMAYLFVPKENAEAMKVSTDEKIGLDDASAKTGIALKETGFFSKKDPVAEIGARPEVLGEAFRIKEGEESGWIHTDAGSYKIRVTGNEAGRPLTLEESRENIAQIIRRDSAATEAAKKLKDLKPSLNAQSFDETLKAAGAEIKTVSGFKAGAALAEAPGGEQAVAEGLKNVKEGGVTDAIAVPTGAVIALVVKEYPADPKEFEAKKAELKAEVAEAKAGESLKKLLEDLRKGLAENTELMNSIFKRETPGASSDPA